MLVDSPSYGCKTVCLTVLLRKTLKQGDPNRRDSVWGATSVSTHDQLFHPSGIGKHRGKARFVNNISPDPVGEQDIQYDLNGQELRIRYPARW